MTFYRHFIERPDFEVFVMTTSHEVERPDLPYRAFLLRLPALVERLSRTRFGSWVHSFLLLNGHRLIGRKLVRRARQFAPDAIFTVAGNWDWTALAAQRLSIELGVPLIASFNDWFDYGGFPAGRRFRSIIEARFRRFYREADLALCTSEGMRSELGFHPNSHVWYPTGAAISGEAGDYVPVNACPGKPLTVFFGGSLGDWYGPMIERLVVYCREKVPEVRFRIFGALETWSSEFDEWARREGVFGGRVSFHQLQEHAACADLLLLPMGFGDDCSQVERTSFKTKFLDYLSFRRPILVWGPDYCSAVTVAREFDSAECVTSASEEECGQRLMKLAGDPKRRQDLIGNAERMYRDRFHPDRIHEGLVSKVSQLIRSSR